MPLTFKNALKLKIADKSEKKEKNTGEKETPNSPHTPSLSLHSVTLKRLFKEHIWNYLFAVQTKLNFSNKIFVVNVRNLSCFNNRELPNYGHTAHAV